MTRAAPRPGSRARSPAGCCATRSSSAASRSPTRSVRRPVTTRSPRAGSRLGLGPMSCSTPTPPTAHWARSSRACAAAGWIAATPKRRTSGSSRSNGGSATELLQRGVDRLTELVQTERALEPRGDDALAVDREHPRLGLEVERLHLRTQPLRGIVVGVDLLVDEDDPVAELVLELHGDFGHRPADPRVAQLG